MVVDKGCVLVDLMMWVLSVVKLWVVGDCVVVLWNDKGEIKIVLLIV